MKRKLMALMLAGIMVIQSAGTSWAAEFTDGVNVEYGDSSENVNEEAFSDEQTEAEDFEDDSPEKDLTEEAEVPAMASGGTSDKNVKVSFDNGTLIISGSGKITQTSVKNCGHSLSEIKKVIIKKGITSIGEGAFEGCSSLNSIKIPNSVTDIWDSAFKGCSSLNSIEIPNSVTSIWNYAFYGCDSLTDVYYTGNKTQWEKVNISSYSDLRLSKATIHYNSTISTNKKFDLSIKSPAILGNQNSISVDFEATTPGNVANEEKAITWKSSNPAIAEIDKNTTGLIDGADGNGAFGWINLLTYDVGEVTITGTTQDGRTASIKFNVEPKIDIKNHSINIWGKKSISICYVTLAKANKNYLQSYLESLKLETTGTSVKIENTTIKISDDGKSAELVGVLQPNATGETSITLSSPNGQKETINVNVTNGKITIQDYDYSKDLDRWMNDQGTANSMAYLSKEENFVNSLMVANYDSSFLDEFIENTTNLVYGGVEGWKNYWNNATKTEQAREILVALLTSYEGKVEELSMIETANKFTDIYISTLKNSNWAYAVAYGLDLSLIHI